MNKITLKQKFNCFNLLTGNIMRIKNNPEHHALAKTIHFFIISVFLFSLISILFILLTNTTFAEIIDSFLLWLKTLQLLDLLKNMILLLTSLIVVYWNFDKRHQDNIKYLLALYHKLFTIQIKTKEDQRIFLRNEVALAISIYHYSLWNHPQFCDLFKDVYKFSLYSEFNSDSKLSEKTHLDIELLILMEKYELSLIPEISHSNFFYEPSFE